jgi:hypothetical protein
VPLLTDIPPELVGRGIERPRQARDFVLSLDVAEPWGGGRIEGRVERRSEHRDVRPVMLAVRCLASWLDVAPQLVGQKRFFRIDTYWELRNRGVPIWIDEEVWLARSELGTLDQANWLHFAVDIPAGLPRAVEATFVSFRWRVEASRKRFLGRDVAAVPLLLLEQRTQPVVRVEESPLGSWRLLEWRAERDADASAGPCAVRYEHRRPEDMPLPGETADQERLRRLRR